MTTNTKDVYAILRLLDSKNESLEQNRSELERLLESSDPNCLLNKVFKDVDSKLFEGLTSEEDEILEYITVSTKFFGKVMQIEKKNLSEEIAQDVMKHSKNLHNILEEELNNDEKELHVSKKLYEEEIRDLMLLMEVKLRKIGDKERDMLEDITKELEIEVKKLTQRILKRHQEEEKEAKAVANVYANIINFVSAVICLFILCICLLWICAASDVIL